MIRRPVVDPSTRHAYHSKLPSAEAFELLSPREQSDLLRQDLTRRVLLGEKAVIEEHLQRYPRWAEDEDEEKCMSHQPVEEVEARLLPSKIYLIDRSQVLAERWAEQFSDCPSVEARAGDYFQQTADAIVSPANSFGIMDGGLDLAIRDELGFSVQSRIQALIVEKYHGEMPVGCAEIVETEDERWKYMIAAPTMRIPEPISDSIHPYLAFRAVLLAAERLNRAAGRQAIDSMVCCGLGTGIGRVSENRCAMQMRAAFHMISGPARIPSHQGIHQFHEALLRM